MREEYLGLVDEAREYIDSGELSSTPLEGILEADLKAKDYEALWHHLIQARDLLREEDYPDVY